MVLGLSDKKSKNSKVKSSKKKQSTQAQEAAEMLKKMEDKKAAGDCPFC